jgi:hypothetical protein
MASADMHRYPYGYANLTAQWTNGSLPMSRLDDQATRIMAGYFARGQDQGICSILHDEYTKLTPQ